VIVVDVYSNKTVFQPQ